MATHPVAAPRLTLADASHLALVSASAHSLAMLSCLALFLGACGLTRRLAAPDRLAFAALVTYAFAGAAILIAATVSGFIVPAIIVRMARDTPAAAHQWEIAITAIFQFNQAFARIFTVAASLAIILWSASALRNGALARTTAIYGCLIAPLTILGIAIGHLRLDVHGMAAVALGQAIWFIAAGAQLLR